jgi:exodeoxyribonuclease VII small subunit
MDGVQGTPVDTADAAGSGHGLGYGVPVAKEPSPPDVDALSYEEARAELARVVERLESGGGTLEESLALWELGEKLAEVCQRWLDGARARLDAARPES